MVEKFVGMACLVTNQRLPLTKPYLQPFCNDPSVSKIMCYCIMHGAMSSNGDNTFQMMYQFNIIGFSNVSKIVSI